MSEQTRAHRRPAAVATLVLLAGVAASLAGNLQAINLDNAAPGIGAYISATVWPLWLFGTVELLLHTPWLSNWRDRLTKGAAVLLVASVAAWVSYWHLANVLSHYGYDVASRYAGPLAIDAAMVLATLALNRVGHARRLANGQDTRWVNPGQVATKLANGQDGGQPGLGQALANTEDVATKSGQWPLANDFVARMKEDVAMSTGLPPHMIGQDDGQDLAKAYATVGDEVSDYLASLANHPELDTTSTPPAPLPQRQATERARVAKYDKAAARIAIQGALEAGTEGAQIDAAVSEAFGVSTRTARRLRAEVSGQPVSGPPDDEAVG